MKLDELDKAALVTCVALLAFTAVLLFVPSCGLYENVSEDKSVLAPHSNTQDCHHETEIRYAGRVIGYHDCCNRGDINLYGHYALHYRKAKIYHGQIGLQYFDELSQNHRYQTALQKSSRLTADLYSYGVYVYYWERENEEYWMSDAERDWERGRYNRREHREAWKNYSETAYNYADNLCEAKVEGKKHGKLAAAWDAAEEYMEDINEWIGDSKEKTEALVGNWRERNKMTSGCNYYLDRVDYNFFHPIQEDELGEEYAALLDDDLTLAKLSTFPPEWHENIDKNADFDRCYNKQLIDLRKKPCEDDYTFNHLKPTYYDPLKGWLPYTCDLWVEHRGLPWPERDDR